MAAGWRAVLVGVVLAVSCASDPTGTGGGGTPEDGGSRGGGDDGDQAGGGEDLSWFLPPAGPESPSNNEDAAYKTLDNGDPEACAQLLTSSPPMFPDPPPGGFVTGPRSYYLFMAGAHLCAGDRAAGQAAYQQAVGSAWVQPFEAVTLSRVCNVWTAVTRMVDPAAGPCQLQVDDGTGGGSEPSPDASQTSPPVTEPPAATEAAPAPTSSGSG